MVLLTLVGCGGAVSDEGAVDANGCPVAAADWTGTGHLADGCEGAPATVQISGASFDSAVRPYVQVHSSQPPGIGPSCTAYVIVTVDCGDAGYSLSMLPR